MTDDELRWARLGSEEGPEIPLFGVRLDRMQHPTSKAEFERLVFEAPDWINVVAITTDGRIVMVEQYRFGVDDITTEPVGGLIDPGEEPLDAAKRELVEETGYGKGQWRYLGSVQANPAIQNNICHHWLVENVEYVQPQQPDEGESIRVRLMTLDEVKEAIADGRLRHSLGLSALSRVFNLWDLPKITSAE